MARAEGPLVRASKAMADTMADTVASSELVHKVTTWVQPPMDEREQVKQAATWLKRRVDTSERRESQLRDQLAAIENRGEALRAAYAAVLAETREPVSVEIARQGPKGMCHYYWLFLAVTIGAAPLSGSSPLLIPAVAAILAPATPAPVAGLLTATWYLGNLGGIFAGDRISRSRDFRPWFYGSTGLLLIGQVLNIIACSVRSLPLFLLGWIISQVGADTIVVLCGALTGTYGALTGKTGAIASVSVLAALPGTLMPLVYMSSYPFTGDDISLLYLQLAMGVFSLLTLRCVPVLWYRPSVLHGVPAAPPRGGKGCTRAVREFLRMLSDWFTASNYRPFLLAMIGAVCSQSSIGAFSVSFMFFMEDYTPIGADAQSFIANVTTLGALTTTPFAFWIGKMVDRTGPVRWLLAMSAGATTIYTATMVFRDNRTILASTILCNAWVLFVAALASIPLAVAMLKDPIWMSRDVAGFLGLVTPAVGLFVPIGTILLDLAGQTEQVMTGGRKQYQLASYYATTGFCVVLMVAAAILFKVASAWSSRLGAAKDFEERLKELL